MLVLLFFNIYNYEEKNQSYLADYSKRSRWPDLAEVPNSDTI